MSTETPLLQVGGPLSAGEAGFLQDELARRGVAASLVATAESPRDVRVMVEATDLALAAEVRHEVLGDEVPEARREGVRAREKAWLATGVAFASVLYLGRVLPLAARGLVGAAVAAAVYIACSVASGPHGDA